MKTIKIKTEDRRQIEQQYNNKKTHTFGER